MSGWAVILIPYVKALHIGMIAIWTAGLLALPLMLARHDPAVGQADYTRIRRASHYGYTMLVTPVAVVAIATGTLLIFQRQVYVPWLFAKVVFVGLLIAFHAWVGNTLVRVAETEGEHMPPEPTLPLLLCLAVVAAVLTLVLGKPNLARIAMPEWLTHPLGVHLPLDVPRR